MFTGIVETTGTVTGVEIAGTNRIFYIESNISHALKADQSLSHNGVCLTVEAVNGGTHRVTAIEETLRKTNLGDLTAGSRVNLERCMPMNGRIEGHIVQGHVDDTAICTSVTTCNGSREYEFEFDPNFAPLVIEKGSLALNGISLTVFNVKAQRFCVAVIPYTFEHTNMKEVQAGSRVNIEFDMIGKYIVKNLKHPAFNHQNAH